MREFRKGNPCPVAQIGKGCPGFEVDHIIPLCAGGRDTVDNLHWLSVRDHKAKTFDDVRFCRAYKKLAP